MWLSLALALVISVLGQRYEGSQIVMSKWIFVTMSIIIMFGGLILRWTAILTLGRSFSHRIEIYDDQKFVRKGPYRYIRHPAYTGLVLFFIGWGITFENWISILAMFLLPLVALIYRVRIEEKLLRKHFGAVYDEYKGSTHALIPFVY